MDCQSFPSVALPYEQADPAVERPDLCIGTDDFHTDADVADAFVTAFREAGFRVAVNAPFAGALVPRSRYRTDPRVQAVMVEVNRRLYVREDDAAPLADFDRTAQRIRHCCRVALHGIA